MILEEPQLTRRYTLERRLKNALSIISNDYKYRHLDSITIESIKMCFRCCGWDVELVETERGILSIIDAEWIGY